MSFFKQYAIIDREYILNIKLNQCKCIHKLTCQRKISELLRYSDERGYIEPEVTISKYGIAITQKPCLTNVPNCSLLRSGFVGGHNRNILVFDYSNFEPTICLNLLNEFELFLPAVITIDFYDWLAGEWGLNCSRESTKKTWSTFIYSNKVPRSIPVNHSLSLAVIKAKKMFEGQCVLSEKQSFAKVLRRKSHIFLFDRYSHFIKKIPSKSDLMFSVYDELVVSCDNNEFHKVTQIGKEVLECRDNEESLKFHIKIGNGSTWWNAKNNIK